MNIHKLKLFFYTIWYLKPIQVYYRLYYIIKSVLRLKKASTKIKLNYYYLTWNSVCKHENSYATKDNSFIFLNVAHSFLAKIDWNYNELGKLWTYNLNYFDFLNQENISKETGITLIKDYTNNDDFLIDGKEPYPISLRGINWVKFLSNNQVKDESINNTLYFHYCILFKT